MTHWIDPQMDTILQRLRAQPAIDLRSLPIAEARRAADDGTVPWNIGAPAMDSRDLVIRSRDGAMRARLYLPHGDRLSTVILYVHGGGWTFGSIETHDGTMRHLAIEAGCAVLGIDYRLAPEHPFPAPLDDVMAALAFVEAGGLGDAIAASDIAIAGDSAGANLALAAMLRRRNEGLAQLASGALFYGCYETDFETPSHVAFGGGDYLLTTANMQWYWNNFLGGTAPTNVLAVPMHADLADLPPLYLSAAGLDPLRDDTVRLAQRLSAAHVQFRFDHVPGVVHGCLRMCRELDGAHGMLEAAGAHIAYQFKTK